MRLKELAPMNRLSRIVVILLVLTSASVWSSPTMGQGQNQAVLISGDEIAALNAKRSEASEAASSARKKLAIRRVIREGEALIKKHPSAANRYEVLSILFRSQQVLVSLDKSATNRKAFLATCEKLAAAPNEYAALRLDADLLLTQAKSARQGADSHARSDALRPLVKGYRDTDVEAKVIRIAMIMALEFGNSRLVNDLRNVIAQRLPGDMDLINFQREKLAGQVFGAPFIGTFERGDGKTVRFPMDFLGTTTVLYCWSKEKDGVEDLKALAADWKKVQVEFEKKPAGRFQFVSMNMDGLPDAGESILRGLGLDWQALKMPKGQDNPIYLTYVKRDTPTIVIVSPTGYVALYLSGGRSDRTWERRLQSMLASMWAQPRYCSQLQSIFAGEFLVLDPQGAFDPAAPPEYKAIASGDAGKAAKQDKLPRTAASVPEEKLRAIQGCFIDPPLRYRTPHDQVIANYKKADALCRAAITAHPKAPDLWIVRNRRITALMGLWKTRGDQEAFAAAVVEANVAVKGVYPKGTDVVARLCMARETLRAADADPKAVINGFMKALGAQQVSGPALVATSLLALDTGDRLRHDQYRRTFLDKHADAPTMWTVTAFLLDRYHRYWMYHPPFTAGWTYGRRQGHFLAIGAPENAQRTFKAEFKTLDGETVKIPESSNGKWTVITFASSAQGNGYMRGIGSFIKARPFEDVNRMSAVLSDDADAVRAVLKELKAPDDFLTLLVPGGLQNPIVHQLGILAEDSFGRGQRPNVVILRPNGSIAIALSGLTMQYNKGSVVQNVIEFHDEKMVDDLLARGDLEQAKRLAFAHAPVKQLPPPDAPRNWKPKKISVPHLRSRAKVYLAMGDLKAAFADAEQAYLAVNIQAGYISMRTDYLEETQALKETILAALKQAESEK